MTTDYNRYRKLPRDKWYDETTWEYILTNGYVTYSGIDEFEPLDVDQIVYWYVDEGDYGPEHNAAGMFKLVDGSYVVYTGWCDTTGWDCQSDARFTFHSTLEHAQRFGFGDRERGWFGIELGDYDHSRL